MLFPIEDEVQILPIFDRILNPTQFRIVANLDAVVKAAGFLYTAHSTFQALQMSTRQRCRRSPLYELLIPAAIATTGILMSIMMGNAARHVTTVAFLILNQSSVLFFPRIRMNIQPFSHSIKL